MKSQESLKRPISGSDFGYEIPLKDPRGLEAIMSKEDLTGEGTTDIDGDASDVDKYAVILIVVYRFSTHFISRSNSHLLIYSLANANSTIS